MKDLFFLYVAYTVFFSLIILNYALTINSLFGKVTYQANGDSLMNGWANYPCRYFPNIYDDYNNKPVANNWKGQKKKMIILIF